MKARLSDMRWPEVQELLSKPHAVLIPVGSTEQHGPHLPLSVDSACSTYVAEKAAGKINNGKTINVVVAPTIHYVDVSTFESFPGCIGISPDTEIRLIADITRSFVKQGFKNIIFVNGHYLNIVPINAALHQVSLEYPQAGLFAVDWIGLGSETIMKVRKSKNCLHADELETSMTLVIQPENVRMDKAVKEIPEYPLSPKWGEPDIYSHNHMLYLSRVKTSHLGSGNGIMGDPTVASLETGEKIADAVVNDLAQIIQEVVESENKK
jgi:creatinine amidohydrolase